MNKTLDKLRAHALESRRSSDDAAQRAERIKRIRAEAAAPLVQAFQDVQGELVSVAVVRKVWGRDFDRRDDRLQGLLVEMVGPADALCGLKLRVPAGALRFEVDFGPREEPEYVCVRETEGLKPTVMAFADQAHWLEYFFKVLADLVDLPEGGAPSP